MATVKHLDGSYYSPIILCQMIGIVNLMTSDEERLREVQRHILQLLGQDLNLIGRSHLQLSAGCIARNIGYSDNDYVARNCRELADMGLLERLENGYPYYRISDKGQSYLNGELTLSELESADES